MPPGLTSTAAAKVKVAGGKEAKYAKNAKDGKETKDTKDSEDDKEMMQLETVRFPVGMPSLSVSNSELSLYPTSHCCWCQTQSQLSVTELYSDLRCSFDGSTDEALYSWAKITV